MLQMIGEQATRVASDQPIFQRLDLRNRLHFRPLTGHATLQRPPSVNPLRIV